RPPSVGGSDGSGGERRWAGSLVAALRGWCWLAANLAERTPLLLAVDAAHWADTPGLRLLNYLAHRLDGVPIVAVIATRDVGTAADSGLLDSLLDALEVRVLRPNALSERAIAASARASLGSAPSASFIAACPVATGGAPV